MTLFTRLAPIRFGGTVWRVVEGVRNLLTMFLGEIWEWQRMRGGPFLHLLLGGLLPFTIEPGVPGVI